MRMIQSFIVDHTKLEIGLYISRKDLNTVTYDLRMKRPNQNNYLTPAAIHTLEHLLATFLRNSYAADYIIYVGPMGCQTGFYLITSDTIFETDVLILLIEAFKYISNLPQDYEIPGASEFSCGQYLLQDLPKAIEEAKAYLQTLENHTTFLYK